MIEPIERKELKGINKATEQIHVAIQFLSMAGEFLVDKKDDHSNANLGWMPVKEKFITHPFGADKNYVMELSPGDMTVTLLNVSDASHDVIGLKGKTQKEVTKWIKDKLKALKIEGGSKYKIAPPYDLPKYADVKDKTFKKPSKRAVLGFTKLRTWAEHFVNKYKMPYPSADTTRTWPHHFDHASYIPLAQNKKGEDIKSIGMGLAIHDDMIAEPYFYISVWEKDKAHDLSKMKALSSGYWLNDGFKGAVLPIFDLEDDLTFESRIDAFFTESLDQINKILQQKVKKKNGK
ncbi:hypothetical protein [Portibacter lacus]|uniref:Uncharacterized protein n=1 Tax=Portibacter lacus TaxID=1099794 RepID=A0AA37WGM4_9BACT|nr:hypothetical protein [Portibacter lacus]GLR18479.1 hypothetical protein GCM10007940_30950 [Portibacter lacus]